MILTPYEKSEITGSADRSFKVDVAGSAGRHSWAEVNGSSGRSSMLQPPPELVGSRFTAEELRFVRWCARLTLFLLAPSLNFLRGGCCGVDDSVSEVLRLPNFFQIHQAAATTFLTASLLLASP